MRFRAFAGLSAALLASVTLFAVSSAADPSVPFRIDYRAPSACTDARGFARAVMARSGRARVGAGADSTAIVVRVERREVGFAGTLHAEPPGAAPVDRKVRGDACADVVDALAFIAALTLDPDATSEPHERPEPLEPAPPRAAPPPAGSVGAAAGLLLTPFVGAIPEPAVGYGAFFELGSGSGTFSPSLVLALERVPGGSVERGSGSADFSLTSGALELCPWRVPASGPFEVRACAFGEVGAVGAESHDVVVTRRTTRLWLAAGASARGRFAFAGPFFAFAELGAGWALARQHYHFDSGESVFDTPPVSGFGRFGAGVSIP